MTKKVRFYRSLSILLNLLAAMYISWFVRVKMTGGEDVDLTLQYYVNMLWLMAPYFILAVMTMRETYSALRSLILLLASAVIVGGGAWMILDAQYLREAGQISEALRVLPWYQLFVVAVAVLITFIDSFVHPKPAGWSIDKASSEDESGTGQPGEADSEKDISGKD